MASSQKVGLFQKFQALPVKATIDVFTKMGTHTSQALNYVWKIGNLKFAHKIGNPDCLCQEQSNIHKTLHKIMRKMRESTLLLETTKLINFGGIPREKKSEIFRNPMFSLSGVHLNLETALAVHKLKFQQHPSDRNEV